MSEQSGWQLKGNAAELYERYVVPYLTGPWAPELVEMAALKEGERVLDVACGTGVVTRLAAQKVGVAGEVTGLDVNERMLTVARALPALLGASITWMEGSAVDMPLPDASFDVVLCQQGLQFFPEPLAALRDMHRVLVKSGRLALSVWRQPSPYNIAQREAVGRYVGQEARDKISSPSALADAQDLQNLLIEADFRDARIHPSTMTIRLPSIAEFVLHHLAATPIAEEVAALSPEVRAALGRDVSRDLESYSDGDGVAFPHEVNIATAHT